MSDSCPPPSPLAQSQEDAEVRAISFVNQELQEKITALEQRVHDILEKVQELEQNGADCDYCEEENYDSEDEQIVVNDPEDEEYCSDDDSDYCEDDEEEEEEEEDDCGSDWESECEEATECQTQFQNVGTIAVANYTVHDVSMSTVFRAGIAFYLAQSFVYSFFYEPCTCF